MATCAVCNKNITTKQTKVNCCDCQSDFHGSCVKLTKADIEFLADEGNVWRCEPCSVNRRRSLRLQAQANEGTLTLDDIMKAINQLREEHKQSDKDFNSSYELLNSKLEDNTKALKENTEKINAYLDIIETLTAENKSLKEKVQLLENRIEETEQYSRRNCVEVHGVPVSDGKVIETVKDVGRAIGMNIEDNMIDACHLLGKKRNTDSPPGIFVKFLRRFDAEEVLTKHRAKRELSTRHLGHSTDNRIFINESLTPSRRKLLAMARETRRQKNFKWLWVRGGKIFIRKEDNGPVTIVKCQADLDLL